MLPTAIGNGTEPEATVVVEPVPELPEPLELPDVEGVVELVPDPVVPEPELPELPEPEPVLQAPSSRPAAAAQAMTAPAFGAAECANGFIFPTSICGFVLWQRPGTPLECRAGGLRVRARR